MKATGNLDLREELGWLLATIDAARLLVEMAEGDPDRAARLATNAHAILRLVAGRLHALSTGLGEDPPRARR